MRYIKLTLIGLIFMSLGLNLAVPNSLVASDEFQWHLGEELTYKVKWSFVRLGTLKLQIFDSLRIDNALVYHAKMYMDSNPVLFFVNVHSVYETFIDKNFRLYMFLADEKIDNVSYETRYRFDYTDSLIYVHMTNIKNPKEMIDKTEPMLETLLDGTGMIFYARAHSNATKNDTITAYFEARRGKVSINFKGKGGKKDIEVAKSPIETFYLDGIVHMKAIVGLSGPFKGWFSTDAQRVPLKAELKVFIGNVGVELEDWKLWRASPPRASQNSE